MSEEQEVVTVVKAPVYLKYNFTAGAAPARPKGAGQAWQARAALARRPQVELIGGCRDGRRGEHEPG